MAKPLHHLPHNVIPFPRAEIVQFPLTQLCGCGCGTTLNIREDSFIVCEETNQWYMDEYDFLKGVQAIEFNGRYRFLADDNVPESWYTKSQFYNEMKAYWMNEYSPIA